MGQRKRSHGEKAGNSPYNRQALHNKMETGEQREVDKMQTSAPIHIVVHWPQTEEGKGELAQRAADLHADFVLSSIHMLDCPASQKLQLIQAVIDTARAQKHME